MKSRILFIISALVLVCSCSEKITEVEITPDPIPAPDRDYTSHYYYTYVNKAIINNETIGTDDFTPGPVVFFGDTIVFANNTSGAQSLYFYSLKQQKVLGQLRSWDYNGTTQTFPNNSIEGILVTDNRIYVSNMQSQIDVFNRADNTFITRIGNGNWGDGDTQLLHTHALCKLDDRLYVRTKNRMHTYLEKDVVADKYQSIKWECRTKTDGFNVNNSFHPYSMLVVEDRIYVTEMTGVHQLTCIDPSLVESGNEKYIIDPNRNIPLSFAPTGMAMHTSNRMFIASNNSKIYVYDFAKQAIVHTIGQISSVTVAANKVAYSDGTLLVSDKKSKNILIVDVVQNEIKEFE